MPSRASWQWSRSPRGCSRSSGEPSRIGPVALVIALIAVAMSGRNERLGAWAVGIVAAGWVLGMIIAVITENPVY